MMLKVYRSCRWLVEKLKKNGKMTYELLDEKWREDDRISNGESLQKRTLHRYKEKLRDTFGIEVVSEEGGDYAYYIRNPEVIKNNSFGEWMLNTLATDEKLAECKCIKNRIIVENIPSSGRFLDTITDAMTENRMIDFEYQPYDSPEIRSSTMAPYALVLHNQRWYVLAKLGNGKLYHYSLDRLHAMRITNMRFEMEEDFNASDYYKDLIGIYNSGRKKTRIVIRAFGTEACYQRDLPLHHSQREIGSGEGYADFEIEVIPNNEMIAAILYKRERLKILSPVEVKNEFVEVLKAIKNLYD